MGHSDNLNSFLSAPEDEVERKARKHYAPRSVQMEGPALGGCERALDDNGDFLNKCSRRDTAALRIPVLGVEKLLFRSRMELDFRIHGGDRATLP